MHMIQIGGKEYRDKVLACWLGKNIGGTLGAPWEGKRHTHALTFYDPVPGKAAPNDDLDLQLIWLKMLEEQGVDPSVRTFAEYWERYASSYPWAEYGCFMRNRARGLVPPAAGCFENYFIDEMGSPIRSEIWACLHPGDPQAAARMAWKDSALDHAGGEGTYGEMFWAAVEAAAFVEKEPMNLIRIGLNMIPLSSHVGRAIREAVWGYQHGRTWGEARECIASLFGGIRPCQAAPNHGFEIIGWLYGKDFGDKLCKAVNCGYDTDCTGATLGAVLGIIGGTRGIPAMWRKPVGEKVVLHKFTGDCDAPKNIRELTGRTVALAEKVMRSKPHVSFTTRTVLPPDVRSMLARNDLALEALRQDTMAAIELAGNLEVWLHYGGEPVLRPGVTKRIRISVPGRGPLRVDLTVPKGWRVIRQGLDIFELFSRGPVADRNTVRVNIAGKTANFILLGPVEARGYPAGIVMPKCPGCGARVEACVCRK